MCWVVAHQVLAQHHAGLQSYPSQRRLPIRVVAQDVAQQVVAQEVVAQQEHRVEQG
jgi:hypothetical protein